MKRYSKPFSDTFWPKPNRKGSVHKKAFQFRTFAWCPRIIFALKLWERLWRFMRDLKVEVGRRLGQTTKKLFPQTIADKIYKAMLINQAKLDLKKRLDISL